MTHSHAHSFIFTGSLARFIGSGYFGMERRGA